MLSHAAAQLLKTQDAGYLRTMLAKTRKDIQTLQQSMVLDVDDEAGGETEIVLPGVRKAGSKTVFAEDVEEQKEMFGERAGRYEDGEDEDGDGEEEDRKSVV